MFWTLNKIVAYQLSRKSRMEMIQNYKAEDYRDMVAELVQSYTAIGRNISLKIHF
jgi:hypothetical protein